MGSMRRVNMSDGDIVEVKLVIPSGNKYDNEDRNDFIHGFGTGEFSDRQIESAIQRGWARKGRKVGEWN